MTLPYAYDYDRALERLARDPVNAVDVQRRIVRVPMEEGNVITLQGTGTTAIPTFILEGAIDLDQIEEIKSIFHFDRPLIAIAAHFEGTDLGAAISRRMKAHHSSKVFHCMKR